MDVFRFTKLSPRPNDRTRRYTILRNLEKDHVGALEISGDAPEGDTVVLSVICAPVLSDAARDDALSTARRFLGEIVTGWGLDIAASPETSNWVEEPDGNFRVVLEYRVR
ncbi:MAG: hypothetical protein C0467_22315 [Planctomycetaceae bacterium]|nr:hypothetical protein [Planctomycetaceae bacterium]